MSNAVHVSGVTRPSSGALELYVQLLVLLCCNYSMCLQFPITCGYNNNNNDNDNKDYEFAASRWFYV
jgi:hypothetical protein